MKFLSFSIRRRRHQQQQEMEKVRRLVEEMRKANAEAIQAFDSGFQSLKQEPCEAFSNSRQQLDRLQIQVRGRLEASRRLADSLRERISSQESLLNGVMETMRDLDLRAQGDGLHAEVARQRIHTETAGLNHLISSAPVTPKKARAAAALTTMEEREGDRETEEGEGIRH